ncbi:MAG: ABC transporter permease [Candidatus Aminicenantes bacterium]|nr:ABC transporter permease [Candidatus Aminicenantes bacterium]
MNITTTISFSVRALMKNKFRSFLTLLGIIFGVGAVIMVMSLGYGAQLNIEERFAGMSNNLSVMPGSRSVGRVSTGAGGVNTLTLEDALAIADECPNISYVSPLVSTRSMVIYKSTNWPTTVQGVGSDFPVIGDWQIDAAKGDGRFFSEDEVHAGLKICVLGAEVYSQLFGGADAVGEIIRINRQPFTVIGVLAAKGQIGGFGNRDDVIMMPYTTAMSRLLGKVDSSINQIQLSATSTDALNAAIAEVTELLRRRHHIEASDGSADDFTVRNVAEVVSLAQSSTETMTSLLVAIAAVSLLVGGIGIMNIMFASVTERTREIGIRRAIGAKPRDIRLQFLIEAVTLCLIGGLLGILAAVGGAAILESVFKSRTAIPPNAILIAFGISTGVGTFFGYYPAFKASKLNVIEALRYE